MSGLTPILDTLLHHVLGRRAENIGRQPLNRPVRPLEPKAALQSLRSDSRLDPRSAVPDEQAVRGPPATRGRAHPAAATPATADRAGGSSTTLHLGSAARAIADILARFPAPPSAVRPASPLVAAGVADAPAVAARLRNAIESSGLFYESHLARWHRGDFPLQQLAREPQMSRSLPGAPPAAPTDPAPGTRAGVHAAPGPAPSEPVSPALQDVLRHQLEVLANPVLRWEGDIWSGLLLALAIQVPEHWLDRHSGGDDGGAAGEETWHSDLALQLPRLGEVRVDLRLRGERVALKITAESEAAGARLADAGERLRSRLEACGFERVALRFGPSGSGEAAGG